VVVTHWSLLGNIGIMGTVRVSRDSQTIDNLNKGKESHNNFILFQDYICCTSDLVASGACQNPGYTVFSVSTDPAENGNLLWYFNETLPTELAVVCPFLLVTL
jgi:hypothetical protein